MEAPINEDRELLVILQKRLREIEENFKGKTLIGTCGDCVHWEYQEHLNEGWCLSDKCFVVDPSKDDGCIHWKEKEE